MTLVRDLSDLSGPVDGDKDVRYIRSELASRVLIRSDDGRVFVRVDGNEWDAEGYEVVRRGSSLAVLPKARAREPKQQSHT